MKRLALLAASACMAVALAGCGDNAEKKVEDNATTIEQTQPQTPPQDQSTPEQTTPNSGTVNPDTTHDNTTPPPADQTKPADQSQPAQ